MVAARAAALDHLRAGVANGTFNCGHGHCFSVLEVIDTVKKVSGADFPVRTEARRPGDPAGLVADNSRTRSVLNWDPQLDDLETIVEHALNWEKKLRQRNR